MRDGKVLQGEGAKEVQAAKDKAKVDATVDSAEGKVKS